MPLRCCTTCKAEASPDLYCAVCQSAVYCSRACQKKDWRKHKKICKLLNVGHGDMQVRSIFLTRQQTDSKETFETKERIRKEEIKLSFKLFEESTFKGSRGAARTMEKIAKRQTKDIQKMLLFHSLEFSIRFSESEMLSWTNSPLLVMLHFADSNVLCGTLGTRTHR
jgi:hypothetical protein